jgi:hypothetical protein
MLREPPRHGCREVLDPIGSRSIARRHRAERTRDQANALLAAMHGERCYAACPGAATARRCACHSTST